ncbi:TetR/AcrR family transcriptional regulator [Prauserella rugosa]|uniref:TetR family transcriptional regulator n=1 Tax=Prauserella rugosa TaxID=43354 RepID=A0A660CI56_9PSEU|nr:TetR/AcrR family transcriptional regulator [Prauserella rugosa]KID28428.1 transcriptional regulator, TetR family [Prauserella sp. Am3]KMS91923.1 hypothetical protein ACZ91_07155 [Streptomyces regensis]TWH20605.1 TetR family transcriptional regulator [Prauserella rugosa]
MAGRPRSFDADQALLLAMEQFWGHGYEATTVSGLTEAMSITAPSLYAAFGDKDTLFRKAAQCYVDRIMSQVDQALAKASTREAIHELLRTTAEGAVADDSPRGCFMLSEPRLAEHRERTRQRVAARIAQGVASGDVPSSTDPDRLSRFLLAVLVGLSAQAREGADLDQLLGVVDNALSAVPGADSFDV